MRPRLSAVRASSGSLPQMSAYCAPSAPPIASARSISLGCVSGASQIASIMPTATPVSADCFLRSCTSCASLKPGISSLGGCGGTTRKPTMSKPPAAAASINSRGEASMIVRCSRERGRTGGSFRRCANAYCVPLRRRGRLARHVETLVEILAERRQKRLDLAVEEVVGALHHLLLDDDALLRLQLLDQRVHVLGRHHRILVAVDDQARGRAGSEEGEVVEVRRRADRDEALDLGAAHQQLHADPGAEREAGDPARLRFRIDGLRPVERGRRVRELAGAVVERTLRAADAAEIETQRREAAVHELVVELVADRVVHRAAELRVRMQHDGDRRVLLPRRMIAAFDAPGWTGEDDLWHCEPRIQALPPMWVRPTSVTTPEPGQFRNVLTIGFPAVLCRGAGYKQPQQHAASSMGGRAKSKHLAGPRWRTEQIWQPRGIISTGTQPLRCVRRRAPPCW